MYIKIKTNTKQKTVKTLSKTLLLAAEKISVLNIDYSKHQDKELLIDINRELRSDSYIIAKITEKIHVQINVDYFSLYDNVFSKTPKKESILENVENITRGKFIKTGKSALTFSCNIRGKRKEKKD